MLKQGILKTLTDMLSDNDTEKRQHISDVLISLAMHRKFIALYNNMVLTICKGDARVEMLKPDILRTLVEMLSDANTEKQKCASSVLTSLAEHGKLIALQNDRSLTFHKGDARTEMSKQGIHESLINMLSANSEEKWQHASSAFFSLVKHSKFIILHSNISLTFF
jgi:hypothetical protein